MLSYIPITNTNNNYWKPFNLHLFLFFDNLSSIHVFSYTFVRLSSPFSEPGVAAVFFNFGFFYSALISKKRKNTFIWECVFALCLLLTMSMWGYLVFLLEFFLNLTSRKKRGMTLPLLILILVLCSILIINKIGTFSYNDRIIDFKEMLLKAFDCLPFGTGFGDVEKYLRFDSSTGEMYSVYGNYCGLLHPLLYLGFASIYYYYLMIEATKNFNSNGKTSKRIILGFSIVFWGSLVTEPLSFGILYTLLIANGCINKFFKANSYIHNNTCFLIKI